MSQAVMNLIGNLSSLPTQGVKPPQKMDAHAFKKTMDEAVRSKPTDDENRIKQEQKERPASSVKNEINSQKSVQKENRQQEAEAIEKQEAGVETSLEEQMLSQMMPYLMDLLEILGMSEEQLIGTLEKLGIMPEQLLMQENFTAFLQELVGGEQNVLTLDQETLRRVQQIWADLKAIGENEGTQGLGENALSQGLTHNQGSKVERIQGETLPQVDHNEYDGSKQRDSMHKADHQVTSIENKKQKPEMEMQQQEASEKTLDLEALVGSKIPLQVSGFRDEMTYWNHTQEVKSLTGVPQELSSKVLTDQVIRRLEIAKLVSHNEIQMELTPKELGKMTMKLVEQNGVITAQIKVESDRTKELIIQGMDQLKEGLERQGLAIGSFQVDVETHHSAHQMQQQKQKSTKRIQEIINKHLEQLEQEEEMKMASSARSNEDTQIDYMA